MVKKFVMSLVSVLVMGLAMGLAIFSNPSTADPVEDALPQDRVYVVNKNFQVATNDSGQGKIFCDSGDVAFDGGWNSSNPSDENLEVFIQSDDIDLENYELIVVNGDVDTFDVTMQLHCIDNPPLR